MIKRRKSRKPSPPRAKRPPIELVADALELPKSLASGIKIELSANTEAVVEGKGAIAEYDENIVKIESPKLNITIAGTGLILRTLSEESIVIEGKIASLDFEERAPK